MLGNVLKGYRCHYETSQAELARQIGISKSTLCRIEQGLAPDAKTMFLIIKFLFEESND